MPRQDNENQYRHGPYDYRTQDEDRKRIQAEYERQAYRDGMRLAREQEAQRNRERKIIEERERKKREQEQREQERKAKKQAQKKRKAREHKEQKNRKKIELQESKKTRQKQERRDYKSEKNSNVQSEENWSSGWAAIGFLIGVTSTIIHSGTDDIGFIMFAGVITAFITGRFYDVILAIFFFGLVLLLFMYFRY